MARSSAPSARADAAARPRGRARARAANGARATPPAPPPPARLVGKYERLAYERDARDRALAAQPGGHPLGFWFDDAAAARAVTFIEQYCRHFEGEWAGQPLLLAEWQRFIFRTVFGWKRADGTRRFRVAYQEVARKNGKSTAIAAAGDYLLIADEEPGAQVYATATKEDQAKIVWGAAREMVKRSPALKRFVTIRQKALVCERLHSFFRPLGSDSETLDGLNPHGHLCDELHAHKDRKLWDVMETAQGARRQPLTFVITTAGQYEPESIGWQQHAHATAVLEGTVEDQAFFAIIFAIDAEDEDWTDPALWGKANPNLGISVKPEFLAAQCAKAKQQPSFTNTFLRLHLNRWTQQAKRWIDLDRWSACDEALSAPAYEARFAALAGARCFGGLDLSAKLDLTALALVFPDTWDLLLRFWIPEDNMRARVQRDRVPYDAWVRDGWLQATPGNVIDYEFIHAEVLALAGRFELQGLAFDPWSATQTATYLGGEGVPMIEVGQGFKSLSEPSKKFEELVVAGQWRHGGHPVMRWCVSNVAARQDPAGNIKPDKSASTERIDGVVATIMAVSRAILESDLTSVYETRGLVSVEPSADEEASDGEG